MDAVEDQTDLRSDVIEAATRLLDEGGTTAVTTRRVAELAGTQAPTIYRLFGDKDGLLDAVAEQAMAQYTARKTETMAAAVAADTDPVQELRDGWLATIGFGVSRPSLYALMIDPQRARRSRAVELGRQVLAARVHRVAETGRLRVSEQRALAMIQAAGTGAVLTILSSPEDRRDPGLAESMMAAVFDQILLDANGPASEHGTTTSLAVGLRARADDLDVLTTAERALLSDWLDRVVAADSTTTSRTASTG